MTDSLIEGNHLDEGPQTKDNPWLQTFTGRAFDLWQPTPDMICTEDIAQALARIPRFAGHTRRHYSVAQHSVMVYELVGQRTEDRVVALHALLHDAHEAYTGDISTPVVWSLGPISFREIKRLKARCQEAVVAYYGLPAIEPFDKQLIKQADVQALFIERRDLMLPCPKEWQLPEPELPKSIIIQEIFDPDAAATLFKWLLTELLVDCKPLLRPYHGKAG